jgi:signal transduction histidine kinase
MKENVSQTAHIISSVAHDLRSPLNAVIGFSRIMLKGIDGPLSDLQATDLEAIYSNGNTMLEMVDNVIDLAKMEAGWLTPSPKAVYLQTLLEKVRSLTTPSIQEGQIELVHQVSETMRPIQADPSHVQKVLERLITAVMHFVGSGKITLTVEVVEGEDEMGMVRVVGMATERLAPDTSNILQAFESTGTSHQERIDGIALKMLASRQLIALNHGRFWITDSSETQITLAFCFPLTSP